MKIIRGSFVTVAITTVLLAGCVSSKKYKASQATLQQVRMDSMKCAQEVASLNQNVQSIEQKNKDLQQSLDSTTRNYATQQKNLDYYQTYFSKQQGSLVQVGQELKNALTQAGLTDQEVQQTSEGFYIVLDEGSTFKNNSVAVTTKGQQALDNVAMVLKSHPDVNVTVAIGDESMANSMASPSNDATVTDNKSTTSPAKENAEEYKEKTEHKAEAKKTTSTYKAEAKAKTGGTQKSYAVKHKTKQVKNAGSEGNPTTFRTGSGKSKRNSVSASLKTARVHTVARNLVKSGVPKVSVLVQEPAEGTTPSTGNGTIKIIVSPTMTDFKPEKTTVSRIP